MATAFRGSRPSPVDVPADLGDGTTLLLPVLDLGLLAVDGGPERLAKQLDKAMVETGFFFLQNHGVPQDLIEGAFGLARRVHALPLDEKLKLKRNQTGAGYLPLGDHTRPNFYSKPSGNAAFFLRFPDDEKARNQWPEELGGGPGGSSVGPGYRALATEYTDHVIALARRVFRLLARALDLPEEFFNERSAGSQGGLRLNHYPEGAGFALGGSTNAASQRMGFAAHTDGGILTFLGQSDKPGLELCLPDGRWVRPQSMPGSFLVNSGDLLRRWTNHKWLSTLHRVVNIPGQERQSIPYFVNVRPDITVTTLPGCATPENPDRYGPITPAEFSKRWVAGEDKFIRTLTPAQVRAAYEGAEGLLGEGEAAPEEAGIAPPAKL